MKYKSITVTGPLFGMLVSLFVPQYSVAAVLLDLNDIIQIFVLRYNIIAEWDYRMKYMSTPGKMSTYIATQRREMYHSPKSSKWPVTTFTFGCEKSIIKGFSEGGLRLFDTLNIASQNTAQQ